MKEDLLIFSIQIQSRLEEFINSEDFEKLTSVKKMAVSCELEKWILTTQQYQLF